MYTLAGVTAIGRVRFTAPGIEGTCDHLTILSATGEVLLKGNIHLKTTLVQAAVRAANRAGLIQSVASVTRLLQDTLGESSAATVNQWVTEASESGELASAVGIVLTLFTASRLGETLRKYQLELH